jgi:hypothetical protein
MWPAPITRSISRYGQPESEQGENWIDRDPELTCYLPGIPRAMYMPYPFQIVQGTNKIEMAFTFANAARTIHLDKVEGPPDDFYCFKRIIDVNLAMGNLVDIVAQQGRAWAARSRQVYFLPSSS